jgi:hypothetical protein
MRYIDIHSARASLQASDGFLKDLSLVHEPNLYHVIIIVATHFRTGKQRGKESTVVSDREKISSCLMASVLEFCFVTLALR